MFGYVSNDRATQMHVTLIIIVGDDNVWFSLVFQVQMCCTWKRVVVRAAPSKYMAEWNKSCYMIPNEHS